MIERLRQGRRLRGRGVSTSATYTFREEAVRMTYLWRGSIVVVTRIDVDAWNKSIVQARRERVVVEDTLSVIYYPGHRGQVRGGRCG